MVSQAQWEVIGELAGGMLFTKVRDIPIAMDSREEMQPEPREQYRSRCVLASIFHRQSAPYICMCIAT